MNNSHKSTGADLAKKTPKPKTQKSSKQRKVDEDLIQASDLEHAQAEILDYDESDINFQMETGDKDQYTDYSSEDNSESDSSSEEEHVDSNCDTAMGASKDRPIRTMNNHQGQQPQYKKGVMPILSS